MLFFHDFKAKNSKEFVYYNENMYTNSYFQMNLSRWGKLFRWYRKNKKCSIFHDLSEYIIFSYDCIWAAWSFKKFGTTHRKWQPASWINRESKFNSEKISILEYRIIWVSHKHLHKVNYVLKIHSQLDNTRRIFVSWTPYWLHNNLLTCLINNGDLFGRCVAWR
jgi:hypothetical protein